MSNSSLRTRKILRVFILSTVAIIFLIHIKDTNRIAWERKRALDVFTINNIGLLDKKQTIEKRNEVIINYLMNLSSIYPLNDTIKSLTQNAQKVTQMSKVLNDWIDTMKTELVMFIDQCNETQARERVLSPLLVKRKGSYRKTNHFFGTNNPPGNSGYAHELKVKIGEYRDTLLTLVKPENKIEMSRNLSSLSLETPENNQGMWEMYYFYELPLSAALVELTKWQNEIRNAENELLNYFQDQIENLKKD